MRCMCNPRNDYFEMRIPWKTLGDTVYNRHFSKNETIFLAEVKYCIFSTLLCVFLLTRGMNKKFGSVSIGYHWSIDR